jgi:hypothetical protein
MTTNYDLALEQAFSDACEPVDVLIYSADFGNSWEIRALGARRERRCHNHVAN